MITTMMKVVMIMERQMNRMNMMRKRMLHRYGNEES